MHGEAIEKDGAKYIGGFKNGKRHGKGSVKTPKQETEGEFEDGEWHGHFNIKYIGHEYLKTFEGLYKHGKKNGLGIVKFKNGTS